MTLLSRSESAIRLSAWIDQAERTGVATDDLRQLLEGVAKGYVRLDNNNDIHFYWRERWRRWNQPF